MFRQAFAVAAYLAAMACNTYLTAWVLNLDEVLPALRPFVSGIDRTPARIDLRLPPATSAAVNLALLCVLALQHNVMSRMRVKAAMRPVVPFAWERSVFVAAASAALGLALLLWQPLPHIVWRVPPPADTAVAALSGLGFLLFMSSMFTTDPWDLFGLRQAFSGLEEHRYPRHSLVLGGLCRFVRHPMYLGLLTFLLAAPTMAGRDGGHEGRLGGGMRRRRAGGARV
ncbi:hypothetical protein GPECTOR_21g762 [Gonium pectorale]|uniref:Nuclear envelope membrane protein n=1 Tax=Gonium pectorale TaxID=33097 RepID=A0A150GI86_GONPE|nr:hypothetical protein GPECTOR_21g762 [Gonium pectorale]|eukprot:KXZ49534.1 hypothetical protein GPECTOR_21g762 [Gonium pectorale]